MGCSGVFITQLRDKVNVRFSVSPLADSAKILRGYLLVGCPTDERDLSQTAKPPSRIARRILRNLSDPAFIIAFPARTIGDCNETAISVLGFKREELVGRRLLDLVADAGKYDQGKALIERIDKTYAEIGFINERLRFTRRNGPPLLCDCISLPFFAIDGSLSYKISILFDRSREELREAKYAEFIDRAERLARDLEVFMPETSLPLKGKRLSNYGFRSRQIEISRLAIQGLSSKEIGSRLGIAESTVKNHLAGMYRKLGVRSRIDFMRILNEQHIDIS